MCMQLPDNRITSRPSQKIDFVHCGGTWNYVPHGIVERELVSAHEVESREGRESAEDKQHQTHCESGH